MSEKTELQAWWDVASELERRQAADAAGTSVGYLYLIVRRHKRPGAKLALRISDATRVPVGAIRHDLYGGLVPASAASEQQAA